MNKPEQVVMRYELARQSVRDLESKRKKLMEACEYTDYDYFRFIGKPCAQEAWDYMVVEDRHEEHGDNISWDDAFYNFIRDDKGACDNCLEARRIKVKELSDAKKEFGLAKRQLSYVGKRLLEGE